MSFSSSKTAIALMAIATGFIATTSPAQAFTITQSNDLAQLVDALLGDTTGLTNLTGQVNGNAAAFGIFEDDPFGFETGIVLSTGIVEEIPGQNTSDGIFSFSDLSTALDDFGFNPGALFDTTTLEIQFDVDTSVEKLFFQYVFGSEEFLDYAGDIYNDFFTLELNGVNLAILDDSVGVDNLVSVNNLAASSVGPFSSDYVDNPAGPTTVTKLDGYTQTLTFEGELLTGTNTLKIQVADVTDAIIDSAVFVKGQSLGTSNPQSVPEPSAIASLLLFGICGTTLKLKQARFR